jgi:hypothetical protein
MATEKRNAAVAEFTSKQSNVKILSITYSCGTVGLSIHDYCARVVCVEPPLNLFNIFSSSGKIPSLRPEGAAVGVDPFWRLHNL